MSQTKRRPGRRGPGMHGMNMMPDEKPKNLGQTLNKLARYSKRYLPAIILSLIATAIGTWLQILAPDKLKVLTDEISKGLPMMSSGLGFLKGIDMVAVKNIVLVIGAIWGLSALLGILQSWTMATVTQRIAKNLRSDITGKIQRLPISFLDKMVIGDVLSRVTNDVDLIAQTLGQSASGLIMSITMLIGALIMMLMNNWLMTLTAIIASLIGFFAMGFIMKRSQKHFVAQQTQLGDVNGHIEEVFGGLPIIKAYNHGPMAAQEFNRMNEALFDSAFRSQFYSGLMMPLMGFVGNLAYVAVSVVGAVLVMNGSISFGVIVAFMMYVRMFTQPLVAIAQAFNNLQRSAAAGERVFEMLDAPDMTDETDKTLSFPPTRGKVSFQDVRFGYVPGQPIIHNFSAEVEPGQKVAIVGPTGAGKTTMVNLLMRFYELDGGHILVDGVDIASVKREKVHELFAMVLQDTWLFEGTIMDNIVYAKKGVNEEEVIAASKRVGLHHFIQTLPDGYQTVLTDKVSLSEGQKQLITIARAMVQDAPLLILDEATSSVDTRTERIVQSAMDNLSVGRTSFVIAHRLSTIKNADLILVMKDGDIVESGHHQELLNQGGFYAKLYNSQFDSAESA